MGSFLIVIFCLFNTSSYDSLSTLGYEETISLIHSDDEMHQSIINSLASINSDRDSIWFYPRENPFGNDSLNIVVSGCRICSKLPSINLMRYYLVSCIFNQDTLVGDMALLLHNESYQYVFDLERQLLIDDGDSGFSSTFQIDSRALIEFQTNFTTWIEELNIKGIGYMRENNITPLGSTYTWIRSNE